MTLAPELEALIAKATPGDLSTAEVVGGEETVECPLCSGQGEVPQDAHYTNFDAVALGVQFYGIGPHFGAHQDLWSWLMKHRETILAALKDRDVVLEEAAKVASNPPVELLPVRNPSEPIGADEMLKGEGFRDAQRIITQAIRALKEQSQ